MSVSGAQSFPTSWVRVDVDGGLANFLTWTVNGDAITGTISGADVSAENPGDSETPPEPIAGHVAGNQVELTVDSREVALDLAGTISPTSLVLHYDGIESGTSETVTFTPGSAATYAAAVASLKQANGGRHFDEAMKSDLREVAIQMETYLTDNTTYPSSITSVSPGELNVGGQTVQLTDGDAVTLAFAHADSDYCLIASNPATAKRWIYDSSHGGISAWTAQSCQG